MKFSLSPGKAGLIGSIFASLFFLIFVTLGFVQPEYNPIRTTISSLVLGKYGWVQTINFILLALSFIFVGFGLGKYITKMNTNRIFAIFLASAISVIAVALIPTDKLDPNATFHFGMLSTTGKVHYLIVLVLLLLTPLMFSQIIRPMKKEMVWKSYVTYTVSVLVFNFIVGIMWFILVNLGYLAEWKGLIQKILATNVLVWLSIVGYKLWTLDTPIEPENR